MKCPYCDYINGFDYSSENYVEMKQIEGIHGPFYFSSTNQVLIQNNSFFETDKTKRLVGCPNCNKVFMDH